MYILKVYTQGVWSDVLSLDLTNKTFNSVESCLVFLLENDCIGIIERIDN